MTAIAPALARVVPPERPLGPFRLLRTLTTNPLGAWPEAAYDLQTLRAHYLRTEVLLVMDPDLIRRVLVEEADAFVRAEATKRALDPAVGEAILTSDGERWRWQRRTAAPIFRHDRIIDFFPAIADAAEHTRDRWLAGPPSEMDIAAEMRRVTFDVIIATMLSGRGGIDLARFGRALGDFLEVTPWPVALAFMRAPAWTPYPGQRRAGRALRHILAEVHRVADERRASGERRNDLLTMLIEATDPETGRKMDATDVAHNLFTFIAAGHETTALALTWTFYLLHLHPEIEARVLAEIAAVTEGGVLTAAHVERLAYLRQVVQEAMRLYPPAPVIARTALGPMQLGPQKIEAGATVMIPVYAVHRHRRLWSDPDRFDPDRFLPQEAKARHRYAYLPFGAGPRVCIGMSFALFEAVVILAKLLPAARLALRPGYSPQLKMRVTLHPGGGMPMRVAAR